MLTDILAPADPAVYEFITTKKGPAGQLPLNADLLRHAPSGDLFGWSQNVGMGWNPALLGGKEFLILSTHGGLRAEDGSPIALGFHSGFAGQAAFADGILALARDFGADVIVDDVIYFDEPFFQDGVVARAVDTVHDAGVVYVAAAGNAGRRGYAAPFRNEGETGFYQPLSTLTRRRA